MMTVLLPGLVASSALATLDRLIVFGTFLALGVYLVLSLNYTKITTDERGVAYTGLGGTRALGWDEIDDVQLSPRLIVLSANAGGRRIRLFRGEYGLALEPFELLQDEISRRAGVRLTQHWSGVSLPKTYRYSGLPPGTVAAYAIPVGLVVLFSSLLALTNTGFWLEKAAFLAIGLAVIAPFILRDRRRYRRTLCLSQTELREANGHEIVIPWHAIDSVLVREPISLGYGSVSVTGNGGEVIHIPRSMPYAGEALYLIVAKSGVSESYGHDV
jgi:hypothetical protein